MARIKNTQIYDYDTLPTFDDYIIGTDAEDSKRTKNYRIADIVALIDGSATNFLALTDTPVTYSGQAGNAVIVNDSEDGLEFGTIDVGNFVTLDTIQTITARKYFASLLTASQGILLQSANPFNNFINIYGDSLPTGTQNAGAAPALKAGTDGELVWLGKTGTGATIFDNQSLTSARTFTLPNKSGTIALLDDVSFIGLVDTPSSYSGEAGKVVIVNNAENGIEFTPDIPTLTANTFTPTITDSGGGATYSASTAGRYFKLGNMVWINIQIATGTVSGSPTGNLQIENLPFDVAGAGLLTSQQLTLGVVNNLGVNFYSLIARANSVANAIVFNYSGTLSDDISTPVPAPSSLIGFNLNISGFYLTE